MLPVAALCTHASLRVAAVVPGHSSPYGQTRLAVYCVTRRLIGPSPHQHSSRSTRLFGIWRDAKIGHNNKYVQPVVTCPVKSSYSLSTSCFAPAAIRFVIFGVLPDTSSTSLVSVGPTGTSRQALSSSTQGTLEKPEIRFELLRQPRSSLHQRLSPVPSELASLDESGRRDPARGSPPGVA